MVMRLLLDELSFVLTSMVLMVTGWCCLCEDEWYESLSECLLSSLKSLTASPLLFLSLPPRRIKVAGEKAAAYRPPPPPVPSPALCRCVALRPARRDLAKENQACSMTV